MIKYFFSIFVWPVSHILHSFCYSNHETLLLECLAIYGMSIKISSDNMLTRTLI